MLFRFPAGPGIGRDIFPIYVPGQHVVGVQPGSVDALEQVFSIHRNGRPEHQPLRLVGGVVEVLNTPVERDHPGDGDVLLRRHRARQGDVEAQAGRYRRVLVRGVHGRREGAEHPHFVPEVHGRKIGVEGQERAVGHGNAGPPPAFQRSPDDSPYVFDAQLFRFGRRVIFRKRLGGSGGYGKALQKLAPLHAHGLPVFVVSAAAARNFDSAIMTEHAPTSILQIVVRLERLGSEG